MTIATRATDSWHIAVPQTVGSPGTLLARLRAMAEGDAVALGVDFPIGLPIAYVDACRPPGGNFPDFLRQLAAEDRFFAVATDLVEVSAARPFYPMRGAAGMTRAAHAAALGLAGPADLSRACDRATGERRAGAPLFWTLGANQVGKAALHAWQHVLIPALLSKTPPLLWPFDGAFRALVRPANLVIAETYPAEALRQLNLRLPGSKRRQSDRRHLADALLCVMAELQARPSPSLSAAIHDGFGPAADGEDPFDSLLGVLCVLNVLAGRRTDTAPEQATIRLWEGWVLGQTGGNLI